MLVTPFKIVALFTFACTALAVKNPAWNIQTVQYAPEYNTNEYTSPENRLNGFTHYFREKCLQWCGSHDGHHNMVVTPLRLANAVSVTCYCCPHSPTNNGLCYTQAEPYSSTDQLGPLQYCTTEVVSMLKSPKVSPINQSAIDKTAVPALQATAHLVAGAEVSFRWRMPVSQVGGVYFALFKKGTETALVKLSPQYSATTPATMSGSVQVYIQSSKSIAPLYTVAQAKFNIAPRTKRVLPMRLI